MAHTILVSKAVKEAFILEDAAPMELVAVSKDYNLFASRTKPKAVLLLGRAHTTRYTRGQLFSSLSGGLTTIIVNTTKDLFCRVIIYVPPQERRILGIPEYILLRPMPDSTLSEEDQRARGLEPGRRAHVAILNINEPEEPGFDEYEVRVYFDAWEKILD